jgi:hypothetical protein
MGKKATALIIITICFISVLLLLPRTFRGGNTSSVKRTINQSDIYSEENITDAMEVVEQKFKSHFSGCTLTDLWYAGDTSIPAAKEWANHNNADKAIILLSNFDVDSSGGDGSLEPGKTFKKWNWILIRKTGSSKWTLLTWGYG